MLIFAFKVHDHKILGSESIADPGKSVRVSNMIELKCLLRMPFARDCSWHQLATVRRWQHSGTAIRADLEMTSDGPMTLNQLVTVGSLFLSPPAQLTAHLLLTELVI